MGEQVSYGFGTKTALPYAKAVEAAKAALKEQGFGVLSEIDVRATLKEKRGIDFRPYVILGACNPSLAEQAFTEELEIGLLLPCNVIVYESDGGSVIEALDPERAMEVAGNERLRPIAAEAKLLLRAAIDSLSAKR